MAEKEESGHRNIGRILVLSAFPCNRCFCELVSCII